MKFDFRFLFLIISIIFISCSKEESAPTSSTNLGFELTYGGEDDDVANSGVIYNENLFVIGTSQNKTTDSKDIYLLKLDLNGNVLFEKHIGGLDHEEGVEIILTNDGNLLLLGSIARKGGNIKDILLIKVDELGNEIWMKVMGENSNDIPVDLMETASGNICILGSTNGFGAVEGDIYLIQTDEQGTLLWSKTFGENDLDGGASILEDGNGDILVFAYTKNYGAVSRDYYLMRLTASGDSIWAYRYGGTEYEESQELVQTEDDGFLMIGHSSSTDPIHNMFAVKTDKHGIVIWEKNYGGVLHDGGQATLINNLGYYVFVGRTDSYGAGEQSIFMITTDADGKALSQIEYGGVKDDRADKIIEYGSYYYVIGQSNSFSKGDYDVYVIKHLK